MSASSDAIQKFMSVTGADIANARTFLESCRGDLDAAMNSYFAVGAAGSASAGRPEPLPAPQPQVTERLFGPSPGGSGRRAGRKRQRRRHPFEDNTKLARMFRAPEYHFKGTFVQAAELAAQTGKWLLVNLQDDKEFSSHRLNRDLWNAEGMREFVEKSFVFWQPERSTDEGVWFYGFYKPGFVPYVAVIDPRTRRAVRTWDSVKDLLEDGCSAFREDLERFVESKPPQIALGGGAGGHPPRKRARLNDEEKMRLAIEASIRESRDSSSAAGAETKDAAAVSSDVVDLTGGPVNDSKSAKDAKSEVVNSEPTQAEPPKPEPKPGPEPPAGPDTTTLNIRLPGVFGARPVKRRFLKSAKISEIEAFVWAHAASLGADMTKFSRSNIQLKTTYPRKVFADPTASLQQENLLNSVVVVEMD